MTLSVLVQDLGSLSCDPVRWTYWAFPWGKEGTDLANASGPEPWQLKILTRLRDGLISVDEALRLAVTSGHGVGKSALVAWIILWAMSTCPDTRGVVTANTETQLKTKTWVELATWHRRFIARDLFKLTATALFSTDKERERTWRIDMVPWSERNTEAFAGLHNRGKRILLVMDEASSIPDMIWEVAEGALTDEDTEIIWVAFGNPTRNKGRFRDCHPGGRFAHRWKSLKVDSRTVSFTNKAQIEAWIKDYGTDSDFVRVRVLGEFPRVDAESFIPFDLVASAVNREIVPQGEAPLILGVDVGRFGDDPSVIYPRRGRDAVSIPPEMIFGQDLMTLASKIVSAYNTLHADMVMIDGGGLGAGVVDRVRQLRVPVIEVQFGAGADYFNEINPQVRYKNKRAEIWGAVRDWLPTGAIPEMSIPSPSGELLTLVDELTGPTYGLAPGKGGVEAIQLESKKDMRTRGVASPNVADALACTFAYPGVVARNPMLTPGLTQAKPAEYDPFDKERIYAHV